MNEFTIEKLVGAPKAKVWEVAADIGRVELYHPMVEKSVCTTELQRGRGAARRCDFYDGKGHAEEVVTSWNEGTGFTLAVTRGTMPFKSAEATFTFTESGPEKTLARVTMRYRMKGGPLGTLLGKLMMTPMMKKMLGSVLDGLDVHCRTGKRIGHKGVVLDA
ncbi:MAG TPA: SRPBCC family protein [Novimethylophilus sp.]|uniref:SRPBCC family protein n=1 Tax=Novimethylophilus sp. TaxID=2137426 RepID=UPI002F4011E4